jgi:hypothetical protein
MSSSEYKHGEMEISDQKATYEGFMVLIKWGSIFCFALAFAAAWLTGIWFDGLIFAPL